MKLRWISSITMVAMMAAISAGTIAGCEKKKKKKANVRVVAKGASALDANAIAANFLASKGKVGIKLVSDPNTAAGEYEGMGVVTSDAVVDSLKVHLLSVAFMSGPGGGGSMTSVPVNQELDVADGVNMSVTGSGEIEAGTYLTVGLTFSPKFKIKAYAYFDRDNDDDIDTTVFTTANGVQVENNVIAPNDLEANGYDEYEYGFLYTYCSNSTTNSTASAMTCGTHSVLPAPVTIAEKSSPTINILISGFKNVFAWTGDGTRPLDPPNDYGYTIKSPFDTFLIGDNSTKLGPVGFPLSGDCSDGENNWGLNDCDFFPQDTPAFRVGYLPAFAFLDTEGLELHTYLITTQLDGNGDPVFNHYSTATMTLVMQNNVPQLGMITSQHVASWKFEDNGIKLNPPVYEGGTSPILGSAARLFEENNGEYTFYMDYGVHNASGVNDGGLYYNNDKTMAGYIAEGFVPKANVGDTGSFTVRDGPRCSDEYNYCWAKDKNTYLHAVLTDTVDADEIDYVQNVLKYDEDTGKRTYYFKRVK